MNGFWSAALLAISSPSPHPNVPKSPVLLPPSPIGAINEADFLLSLLVWAPTIGAIICVLVPNLRGEHDSTIRLVAFWASLVSMAVALSGYIRFGLFQSGLQMPENRPWMGALGTHYQLGLDGVSAPLVLVCDAVFIVVVLASWGYRGPTKAHFALLLAVETAVNGLLVSQNLLMFLVFWQGMAFAVYLLTAVSAEDRNGHWANRYLAYEAVGGALMLLGMVIAGYGQGHAESLSQLATPHYQPFDVLQYVSFVFWLAACMIRMGAFPLHRGMLSGLRAAPAGVDVLLASVVGSMGGYGLIRLNLAFDPASAKLQLVLLLLAAVCVAVGGLRSLASDRLRASAGWVVSASAGLILFAVGSLTPLGINGAVLLIFARIPSLALWMAAVRMWQERNRDPGQPAANGLGRVIPGLGACTLVAGLSLLGMPGSAGFIGLWMSVLGVYQNHRFMAAALLVALIVLLAAVVDIWRRHFFGSASPARRFPRLTAGDSWMVGVLVGFVVWFGLFPSGISLDGVPIFDQGVVNVTNQAVVGISQPYTAASR